MTDNRTTELREKLTERGVDYEVKDLSNIKLFHDTRWNANGVRWCYTEFVGATTVLTMLNDWKDCTPEQVIAATLGRPKAKSHPYGYERDTGAYDCTRCECGCINDISATYCNGCGGEVEIDESAEKEYYDGHSKHTVFAKKHDDGSLEFCERRYVPEDAAKRGSEREIELGDALNEVAEKWANAQVEAEGSAKRCMLLEELVRDAYWLIVRAVWTHVSQDKFAADWTERVSVLGIEVY